MKLEREQRWITEAFRNAKTVHIIVDEGTKDEINILFPRPEQDFRRNLRLAVQEHFNFVNKCNES